jgi:hypothetical protein
VKVDEIPTETKHNEISIEIAISDPAKDEASGPSTVSFAPILEPLNEFSF